MTAYKNHWMQEFLNCYKKNYLQLEQLDKEYQSLHLQTDYLKHIYKKQINLKTEIIDQAKEVKRLTHRELLFFFPLYQNLLDEGIPQLLLSEETYNLYKSQLDLKNLKKIQLTEIPNLKFLKL